MSDPAAPLPLTPGVPPAPSEYLVVSMTDGPGMLVTLAPAEDPDPMNNAYKPGQAITFKATYTDPVTLLPVDPTVAPVCTVSWPDASQATPQVIRTAQGAYQATAVVPLTMTMGEGAARMQTTDGANPTNNTCAESRFDVLSLDF